MHYNGEKALYQKAAVCKKAVLADPIPNLFISQMLQMLAYRVKGHKGLLYQNIPFSFVTCIMNYLQIHSNKQGGYV